MELTSPSSELVPPDAEAPADRQGPWQLTDLIDTEALQSIQDTFAKVFGLPTVIVDPNGRNLTNITHRVSFCEDLTRTSPVGGPRCMTCDLRAMQEAAATDRPAIFHCWNGLYDCAIPIAPKGDVLGYFLCGQIMTVPPDVELIARTAEEIRVAPDDYVENVRRVRVMPLDQYEASINTMHTLARMIADQAAASIDNLKMLQDAMTAREDAARLVEELEVILEAFRDSFAQSDEHATLETIADQLQRLIPCDSCLIYTIDDPSDELVPRIVRDPQADAFWSFRPRNGVGVLGKVAATGVRRKIDDVRQDPDFEPVPGVDVEPEAMLVAPMIRKGTIFGVISLSRLERRVFTEHELRILAVFCSHASLSLQVSRMQLESTRRLREEQTLGELLSALATGPGVEETLAAIGRCGVDVLGARSAVLRCQAQAGAPSQLVRVELDETAAAALLAEIDPELEACLARRACRVLGRRDGSLLLVPLLGGADALGVAVFLAPAGTQWDQNLVDTLADQSSLGLRNAVARERERQVLLQHDLLSTLGTELAQAKSRDEVRTQVLGKSAEMFGSEISILALLDQASDAIGVHVREGRRTRELAIKLGGRGRFASARLSGEAAPEDSVFAAWAQDLSEELARELGVVSHMAAPLRTPTGIFGGLFVAWRSPITRFSPEQQRLLNVVGGAAGASLGNLLARAETDDSLRRRFAELQALGRLAEQITRLTEEGPILEEVLAAIQVLADLDGAVYAVESDGHWDARRTAGLEPVRTAELIAALNAVDVGDRTARYDLDPAPRQLLVIPMPGTGPDRSVIVGAATPRDDAQRDIVLAALARFGSVALENASLHSRHRGTIAGLENANEKLRQVLLVHETLTADVIGGNGIQAVADSLAALVDAEVVVLGSLGEVLARAPQLGTLDWSPPDEAPSDRTLAEETAGGHVAAAPAAVQDDILAWVAARFEASPGQVERSAIEYGALLVALELLRVRTALEVEQRLRGGFLEELFSGGFVEEAIVKQGAAFGLDLTAPTRIFRIEVADGELGPVNGHLLYSVATDCARSWPGRSLVAVEGNAAVVLLEETGAGAGHDTNAEFFEDRLEHVLPLRIPSCRFNIAVSRLVRAPSEYGRAHAAARRGLDLIRLLGRSRQVVSFRHLGVQEILLQVEEPAALLEFIARYVEPLERYDEEHSSKLLASLETFYDAGFNLQEAARRLDVHVSTLRYRLTRIEELLGVDPKVGDSRLNIEVAVRAAKALAVHRD
jgi:ligand-binding sensor protein/sugar diacid utilization regulator/transcriptional regulator with GAF, ATPase, and Fis domain